MMHSFLRSMMSNYGAGMLAIFCVAIITITIVLYSSIGFASAGALEDLSPYDSSERSTSKNSPTFTPPPYDTPTKLATIAAYSKTSSEFNSSKTIEFDQDSPNLLEDYLSNFGLNSTNLNIDPCKKAQVVPLAYNDTEIGFVLYGTARYPEQGYEIEMIGLYTSLTLDYDWLNKAGFENITLKQYGNNLWYLETEQNGTSVYLGLGIIPGQDTRMVIYVKDLSNKLYESFVTEAATRAMNWEEHLS